LSRPCADTSGNTHGSAWVRCVSRTRKWRDFRGDMHSPVDIPVHIRGRTGRRHGRGSENHPTSGLTDTPRYEKGSYPSDAVRSVPIAAVHPASRRHTNGATMSTLVTPVPSATEALEQLDLLLDLSNIRMKLADREESNGLETPQLDLTEGEYRKFLALRLAHPEAEIVPCTLVDEMWHRHILDTRAPAGLRVDLRLPTPLSILRHARRGRRSGAQGPRTPKHSTPTASHSASRPRTPGSRATSAAAGPNASPRSADSAQLPPDTVRGRNLLENDS
jgi:hypothetical protein